MNNSIKLCVLFFILNLCISCNMPEASVAIHCTPGDIIDCRCANGAAGFHSCRDESGEWSVCQCEVNLSANKSAPDAATLDETVEASADEPDSAESDDIVETDASEPDSAESDDIAETDASEPDVETGASAGCRTDADCTDPTLPYCEHYASNRCVECMSSLDCAGDEKCDSETKTCIDESTVKAGCATDYDCNDPLKPVCDKFETQKCVECMVNADCGAGRRCNTANRTCVEDKTPVTGHLYSCPDAEKCYLIGDERYCFAENGEIPKNADYCLDSSESCLDGKLLYMSETGAGDDSKINCRCLNNCIAIQELQHHCESCANDADCVWGNINATRCVQIDGVAGKFCGTGDFIIDMINCLL